jgi:EpsI family protein
MVTRWIVAIAVIGLAGVYAGELRGGRSANETIPALQQLPLELSGWRGEDYPTSEAVARVLAADALLNRCYRRDDGTEIWLFVAYFRRQQVNSQIHSPRHCLPGGGWHVTFLRQQTLTIDGDTWPVAHLGIAQSGNSQDVLYWFRTQSGATAGEYALKWDLVKNSLARRPTNAAFIRYNAASADSTALHEVMALVDAPLKGILAEAGL